MKATAVAAAVAWLLLCQAPAAAQNLLTNPGFDHDLNGWHPTTAPGLMTTAWSPSDAAGSPSSGSLFTDNTASTAGYAVVVAWQCIDVVVGQKYWLRAKAFIPSGQAATGQLLISALPGSGSCSSPSLPFGVGGGLAVSTTGRLVDSGTVLLAPPGYGRMVLQLINLKATAGGSLHMYFDDLVFAPTSTVPCAASPTTLCIDHATGDHRFEARVHYSSPSRGLNGDGHATPLAPVGITEGGAFSFASASNPEMLIKVLDGCGLNDHYWVFFAATTDIGHTVTVRDSTTGGIQTWSSPDHQAAVPVQATSALPCE